MTRRKDESTYTMISATDTLRHFLATVAYRFQTAVGGAPAHFGTFEPGHGVRPPAEIVRHMTHMLKYAHRRFSHTADVDPPPELSFGEEIARFHEILAVLDCDLVDRSNEVEGDVLLNLLQGPLSDVMTHAGQLAMLRRMAGSPVQGQSFTKADVEIGQVGPDQGELRKPCDG